MLKVIDNLLISALGTARLAVLCLAVAMVVAVWVRTRSFGPTFAAVLFGGFVFFGATQTKYLAQLVDTEVRKADSQTETKDLPKDPKLNG